MPGPGDRKGDTRVVQVSEHPLAIRGEADPGPLAVERCRCEIVAGIDTFQLRIGLAEREQAVLRIEPGDKLRAGGDTLTVFADHQAAARTVSYVVGTAEPVVFAGFKDEFKETLGDIQPENLSGPRLATSL